MANNLSNSFCHCCLTTNGSISREPFLIMKDHSFIYNNETITFLDGYLDINNCSIEDLFPCSTISDSLICGLCVAHLESAYVFRELCRQAAITLRSNYSDNQFIKCEEADKVENDSSANQILPVLLENVPNEQVNAENDALTNHSQNDEEKPTYSNSQDKSDADQQIKKFSCPVCPNKYSSQGALLNHKNAKHSNTRFACKICPSVYTAKIALKHHVQSQHEHKSLACIMCGKCFKNQRNLNYHQKTNHLGISYKCAECPKMFKSSNSLLLHNKTTHLGYLYQCIECPKAFSHPSTLVKHKKAIHLKVSYECKKCLKTFKNSSNFLVHKKIIHHEDS